MIIFSLKEDSGGKNSAPDTSLFLKGGDDLVFLIHGLTGTPKEMYHIARALNEKDYTVKVPLLLSHNKSLFALRRASWQELYASIREEFVKADSRYKNIFVGGLSFGALLAIKLAHEFPRKVRAVNSFSVTLFFDGWNAPWIKIFLYPVFATPMKYWFYFKEGHPYGLKNARLRNRVEAYYKNSKWDDYSEAHLYGYPVIPIACMHQNYLLAKHVMRLLGKITVPIQLLQAREDDVTSPRSSEYIYDHIGSKDKHIKFFEDSYHIITADQERDKVAETTISFFNRYK